MIDPLSYFLFQTVPHDWYNKDCGMCYPVCGMMHINKSLLLIGKSSPSSGGSRIPLILSQWSYNYRQNVLSASLNKTLSSFLMHNLLPQCKVFSNMASKVAPRLPPSPIMCTCQQSTKYNLDMLYMHTKYSIQWDSKILCVCLYI